MMKRMKWIVLAAVCLSVLWCGAAMADVVASGDCGAEGNNLVWTLDSEGTLIISGSGAMEDFPYSGGPWRSSGYTVRIVQFSDGVTTIGNSAFRDCDDLESITIPSGIISVGGSAFASCDNLRETLNNAAISS